MSRITWGLNAHHEATVFCSYCRAVFARNIPIIEASEVRNKAQENHHCTPTTPFRPGRQAGVARFPSALPYAMLKAKEEV